MRLAFFVALLGAGALAEAHTSWLEHWRFHPTPRIEPLPPPRDAREAQRQDLRDLAQFARLDRSLSPAASAAFTERLAALDARAGSLDRGTFAVEVARAVALADNGHSWAWAELPRVAVRFAWFEEGLFVVRASAANADLLGARVLALNARTPEAALADLRQIIGGPPQHVRSESVAHLVTPALLHGLWGDAPPDALELVASAPSGARIARSLAAGGAGDSPSGAALAPLIAPAPAPSGAGEWRYALGGVEAPLALREAAHALHSEPLGAEELYIRLNAVLDDERGPLEAQLEALVQRFMGHRFRRIVLDLRFNTGGDYMKTLDFTRALPGLLADDGSLWLLTSGDTFSAAIVTLARVKAFAGPRAHIAGERVGDREVFWAERGQPLALRHSGVRVGYATGMHDWVNGCWNPLRCYWPNLTYGVAAGDLSPELEVGWSFADYAVGRDTVLERVLAEPARTTR